MKNIFTEHPHSIGESYLQHLRFACWLAIGALLACLVFFIHAFFPFVLKTTGSNILLRMNERIMERLATK